MNQIITGTYYGHEIEVLITTVIPEVILDNEIPQCIKDEIFELLQSDNLSGAFSEDGVQGEAWVDGKEVSVRLAGSWRVVQNNLIITETDGDTLDIHLSPERTPRTFKRKVKCLMLSGLTEEEAIADTFKTPITMELFYDIGVGLFCVESEAVDNTPIFNPYSSKEIPNAEEETPHV